MREQPGGASAGFFPSLKGWASFLRTEKGMAFLLLFIAIAFNAVFLWPEAAVPAYSFNDEIVHLTTAQEASAALRQGLNPTDFWLKEFDLGTPFFHYYQNLPHVVLAVIDQFTLLPLARLLEISRYLFLVLFPLSIFVAMRRFGFDYPAAGFSALVASLLSTSGSYGFDYSSYLWWGLGLYTQLWVMFFLPLALAEIYRTIRREGSWFWPVLLSAIVLLSSLIYAFVLVVSAALFLFLTPRPAEILARFKREAVIFLLTGLVTAYYFIPIFLDGAYLNQSIWLQPWKFNSHGATVILTNLFTGNLFDAGRLPVLTLLFFIAALFVLLQWRKEPYRLILVLAAFWLLLYFGRPTWGELLDFLPFSHFLLLHRFIGPFHLWSIMVIGAGLSAAWQRGKGVTIRGHQLRNPLLVALVILLILTPVYLERASFYGGAARMKNETRQVFLAKGDEISAIRETLANLPPGRVYAGISTDFGDFPYYTLGSVPLQGLLPQLGMDTFSRAYAGVGLSSDVRLHFDNTNPVQYNLFNIRYVLLHRTWTPAYYYTPVKEFEDYTLYQVPTSGYFEVVDAPAVFYGNTTGFYYPNARWLWSSLPAQRQHPLLVLGPRPVNTSGLPAFSFEQVSDNILAGLSRVQPGAGSIAWENVSAGTYRARFTANRDSYLMVKTNYHPGWSATLDGKGTRTVMLAPGYVGIPVPPGTHEATFTYEPPFYRLPLLVLGILVLVLLGLYQWRVLPEGVSIRIRKIEAYLE